MKITPLDIRKQDFRRTMRGYDPEEVRNFLDFVAGQMEALHSAVSDAQEELKASDDRLGHYRLIEKNLQDAAITVQKALDETRLHAEKEAELIVREARARAQNEIRDLANRVQELKSDIATLELQRANFFVRMRAVIKSQADLLEAMEGDIDRTAHRLRDLPGA